MKKLLFLFLSIIAVALFSCDTKTEHEKDVVYQVAVKTYPADAQVFIVATYTDSAGKQVYVNQKLPFRKEFDNFSKSKKAMFKGYLIGEKVMKLNGQIEITISGSTDMNQGSDLNFSTNSPTGFNPKELKERTGFHLLEE